MKRIDAVELYVKKRIEKLEEYNGKFDLHAKEISELKDVLDVICQINASKKTQDDKIDAFVYSLSKLNENILDTRED